MTIYTDGAAEPNPGPGGYGVVLICGHHRRELAGGFARTTNNRMEILAAIKGLEALKASCKVRLHSDSQYLVNAMTLGWARRWQAHDWKRNRHDKAVNPDLWERLIALCDTHEVQFVWVRGHAGHRENERCDYLAVQAAQQPNLPADEGYREQSQPQVEARRRLTVTEIHSTAKITEEGQPCRKCSTPVVKRTPRHHKRKHGQSYYYEYYLYCPTCCTQYMTDDAKRLYA
ncbi:MAG: ribonuclease HI [Sedimentisphaerales bacterium]|nr:ribonuclease HI [Sedimentisphaerales bacterium]